jgi:5'(3')-deoxyribonucleotidase
MYKTSVAIDMDDTIAMYSKKVVERLKKDTQFDIDLSSIKGQNLSDVLPKKELDLVSSYPDEPGWFADLEIMEGAKEAIVYLCDWYDVFIVSSCLRFSDAPKDKMLWIKEHLPMIDSNHIIFIDQKQFLSMDYLIDDRPRHLEKFKGKAILFDAFHNVNENRFPRLTRWRSIETMLK